MELPPYVDVIDVQIEASTNTGTTAEPVFNTRFVGAVVATADTFVQSSVEDGAVIVKPRLSDGAMRTIRGTAVSRYSSDTWLTRLSLEDDPISELGSPRSSFQADKVLVAGSPEEAAFRQEQRRIRDEEIQSVQARLREEELAQRARLDQARREAERVRAEAEREAERLKVEAARQAESRRAQEEVEARGRQEKAHGATGGTADAEQQQQAHTAEQSIEISAGTELDVRVTSRLNSGTARVEDRFEAMTVQPLIVDGRLVAPAGSTLRGVVTEVRPATRTNRVATLALTFDQLTVNGRAYPIRASATDRIQGPGFKGEAARTAAGAGVGAIIGGLLGGGKGAAIGGAVGGGGTVAATEGREVELAQGAVLRVRIDAPVRILRAS